MKKSLRQMLLIGLSATMLVSAGAPVIFAQEETTDESAETMETTETTETTETSQEATDTETDEATEASDVQTGVDEAVTIFQEEYPEAQLEEVDVEMDTEAEEPTYTIFVRGFDPENDYELEAQWVNGEMAEQQFNEGMFGMGEDSAASEEIASEEATTEEATTDGAATTEESVDPGADNIAESADEATSVDIPVPDSAETEAEMEDATSAVETDPAMTDEEERPSLDMENLISLDEATDTALQEIPSGQAIRWTLTADTSEFWDFFTGGGDEEGPIWILEVEDPEAGGTQEVRIDAESGEVLNADDIEDPQAESEETQETTETTETGEVSEELPEEVTPEEPVDTEPEAPATDTESE